MNEKNHFEQGQSEIERLEKKSKISIGIRLNRAAGRRILIKIKHFFKEQLMKGL